MKSNSSHMMEKTIISTKLNVVESGEQMKNFIYTLVDYIKQLELAYPVYMGTFDDQESLIVKPTPGSSVIHSYMNGMMDVRLPFEISIKSKNQEEACRVLSDVMNHVQQLGNFLNEGSKDLLLDMMMDQIPTFTSKDDAGYFYYTSTLTVDLAVIPSSQNKQGESSKEK